MTYLQLDGLKKRFGSVAAVAGVSFSAHEGEVVVLLGPSGCGKTTTLRLIAGFEHPDDGVIRLDDAVLASSNTFVPPEKRQLSVVFQNYALWPHMTVFDNVAFGPSIAGRNSTEIRNRVRRALEMVQLGHFERRYPHQLSGGQQQRVALARALVNEPKVLLLDEPLSNLDTRLREEMRFELKRLQQRLGRTMIYVTHDQTEALALADRIVVMNEGRIEQSGSPKELYDKPLTGFAASALGSTNFVDGRLLSVGGDTARVQIFDRYEVEAQAPPENLGAIGSSVRLSVRPSGLSLQTETDQGHPVAEVMEMLFLGDRIQYELQPPAGQSALKATVSADHWFSPGDRVRLKFDPRLTAVLAPEKSKGDCDGHHSDGERTARPEIGGT